MAAAEISQVLQELRRDAFLRDGGELTDAQLLERFVAQRDEAAFAALVRRHGAMVWGVCRRVVRGHHDAEDAFQATFLVLVHKARSIRMRDLLANWLYGVAYQTARRVKIAVHKRQAREKQVAAMPELLIASAMTGEDWRAELDQELSRLPAKYRLPILLCELEGMTHLEAAGHLGWPVGTVSGRLSRARQMLAQRLSRRGLSVSAGALSALLAQQASGNVPPALLMTATVRAAGLVVAGHGAEAISTRVVSVTNEVLRTMWLSKFYLSVGLLAALVLFASVTALALSAGDATQPESPAGASQEDRQFQPAADGGAGGGAKKDGAQPMEKIAGGKISDGWQLTATLENVEVAAGDPVRLTLILRNTTKGKLIYGESSPGFDYLRSISVTDDKGQDVPRTRYGAPWKDALEFKKFVSRTLEPGQQVRTTLNLGLAFDLTKSGTYTIHAKHPFAFKPGQFVGGFEANVVANPVQVKITYPPFPTMQVEDVLLSKFLGRVNEQPKGGEQPKPLVLPKEDAKLFEKRVKELDSKPLLDVIGEESITAFRLLGDPPGKGMTEHAPEVYALALRTGKIVPEGKAAVYHLKGSHDCLVETSKGNCIVRIYYEPVGYLVLPNGESYWFHFGNKPK